MGTVDGRGSRCPKFDRLWRDQGSTPTSTLTSRQLARFFSCDRSKRVQRKGEWQNIVQGSSESIGVIVICTNNNAAPPGICSAANYCQTLELNVESHNGIALLNKQLQLAYPSPSTLQMATVVRQSGKVSSGSQRVGPNEAIALV